MAISSLLAICSSLAVVGYYLVVWAQVGRDPAVPVIVTMYEPPRGLSPALLRYVWKETFDDRTFWAGLLSLVSKGLATIDNREGVAVLHPTPAAKHRPALPHEEQVLVKGLLLRHGRKGLHLSMLDSETTIAVSDMATALRNAAIGRWFNENRSYVLTGSLFSIIPVCLAANPKSLDDWMALLLEFGVMAPAAFYLLLLLSRVRDLYRAGHEQFQWAIAKRTAVVLAFLIPCVIAVIFGSGLLVYSFGWMVLGIAAGMVILNLIFMHLMKAPTAEGARLLAEIEGFRDFLNRVERFPMDSGESPKGNADAYERFLPYAVALEVEQTWCDKFVALTSTYHQQMAAEHAHSYYLGMWNGKPVEVVVGPPTRSGR